MKFIQRIKNMNSRMLCPMNMVGGDNLFVATTILFTVELTVERKQSKY